MTGRALRPETLWQLLLAGVVLVPAAITLADGRPGGVLLVGLVAGFAAWHWLFLVRPARPPRRPVLAIYWLGAIAFAAALAGYGPSFVIVLYGFCPLAFVTLGWWGLAPIVALTTAVTWRAGLWAESSGWISLAATACLSLVIGLVMRSLERQSEERRAALETLAATRAELAETSRRAGALEERQRLARDLHDTVAQGFTSIVTHLEAADQALATDPGAVAGHVDVARRTARDGLGELRRTVQALRPDLLERGTLADALRRVAEDHAVPVRLRITGDPFALHPDTETALLRIAQEALANVARHARATRAVVTLSYSDDTISLDVDDDGTGFDPASPRPGGLGLTGMRERVTAVGGRLDVESVPGEGTTIAASVPA